MSEIIFEINAPYILYADDDPDDLYLLNEMLKSVSPEIVMHGCESGRQAYTFLEELPAGQPLPGAVILDLNMPDWNGSKTLEALKHNETYKDIPVIIFTNSDHPKHKESALKMGAADFITKPYRKDELAKVCNVLAEYACQEQRLKTA